MTTNITKERLAVKKSKNKSERIIALITLASLIAACVIGFNQSLTDISPYVKELIPGTTRYEQLDFEKYVSYSDTVELSIGYVTVKQYNGFGGPLKVAVGVDNLGNVLNLKVVGHKETPSWFKRVMDSQLADNLTGKNYTDGFILDADVDGITGATYTTRAIAESVKLASRDVAVNNLGFTKPVEVKSTFKAGFPEILLLILLLIGAFGIKKASAKNKKRIRWLTLISGMVVIGFIVNHQLTLVDFNKFIMGYWPSLHSQLYWYILTFGVLLIFLTSNKNTYCHYVCPFGAAQECVGLISKAKPMHSRQFHEFFKWFRRGVVWLAVFLALIFRNPGVSSYEVYSTLFNLSGTNREVFFLGIVLVAALFVKRPWCNYLCPIPTIEDYIKLFKNWGKEFIGKSAKKVQT